MQRRDRRLQRERPRTATQGLLHERERLGDLRVIPAATILLFEQDEVAGRVAPRVAPRIVQEHQREKRRRLGGWRRQQRPHEAGEPDRLDAEVGPHERLATRGRIAFGEDEIDHRQHRVEPSRHVLRVGHRVRDAGVANLGLGAHEPLCHRRGRHQEGARDLVRLEAAECAQREGDLGFEGQRRVAAGEDEAKAVVGDVARIEVRRLDGQVGRGRREGVQLVREPGLATDAVDGLVPGRLDDPGARDLGDAGDPPLVHRGGKRFLGGLFGDVEVPNEPDQGGDDPAPIGAIDGVDGGVGIHGHDVTLDNSGAGVDSGPRRST